MPAEHFAARVVHADAEEVLGADEVTGGTAGGAEVLAEEDLAEEVVALDGLDVDGAVGLAIDRQQYWLSQFAGRSIATC